MGGEKHQSFTLLLRHRGSPPRWRGKALYEVAQDIVHGITPAWAGKSPELRGYDGKVVGSPPHGRGKDYSNCAEKLGFGITPA